MKKLFKAIYEEIPSAFNEEFNKLLKEKVMAKIDAKKEEFLNELSVEQQQEKMSEQDKIVEFIKTTPKLWAELVEDYGTDDEAMEHIYEFIEKNRDKIISKMKNGVNEKVVTTEHGYKFDNKQKSEKLNTEHGKIVTDTTEPEVDELVDGNLGNEKWTGVYLGTMKLLRDMNELEQKMAYLIATRTTNFDGTCAEFCDKFADNHFNQKTGIMIK
ncbi:MAG: hypothetical protein WC755_09155 [Candidatus Woesearchaeota archaeon]|jgi:hypothetical protein